MAQQYFVYIMTNRSRTLYIGVTNDLYRRVYEHKHPLMKGFTSKYKIRLLVHYETTTDIQEAIAREKRLKGWVRGKKVALIEAINPEWKDLSAEWFEEPDVTLNPSACHAEGNEASKLPRSG